MRVYLNRANYAHKKPARPTVIPLSGGRSIYALNQKSNDGFEITISKPPFSFWKTRITEGVIKVALFMDTAVQGRESS